MTPISRQEARAAGLKRYFTGVPCAHGHAVERLVSSHGCLACCSARARAAHARDPEKAAAARKRRHDPEKNKVRCKAWAKANAGRKREYNRANVAARPEEVRAYMAAWRKANADKLSGYSATWAKKHPEKAKAYRAHKCSKRRAREVQATPSWADQAAILAVYQLSADLESLTGVPHHVDHIVPLQGRNVCGLHVHYNLRPISAAWNQRKGNRMEIRQ